MKLTIRNIILILKALFLGHGTYAQQISRANLIIQLKAERESIFVINGAAYLFTDSMKIDAELSKIDKEKIAEITIFKNNGKIPHQRNDVILIQHAVVLPPKIKKQKFNFIKPKFKDEYNGFSQHIYSDAKDPVLYVNGNKIHHTEVKKWINKLKLNDIAYVYYAETMQQEEYHGKNAKNGIVIIWTKDKLIK